MSGFGSGFNDAWPKAFASGAAAMLEMAVNIAKEALSSAKGKP
jgi:hypothetical protein